MGQRLRSGAPPPDGRGAALFGICSHKVGRHGGHVHGRHSWRPLLAFPLDRRWPCPVGACRIHVGADGGCHRALHDRLSRGGHAIAITSFVIVMEMTNGTGMVIPMMATALVASRISAFFTPPLYE